MANDELNQGAAKIADTIEEHETVRDLRHVVIVVRARNKQLCNAGKPANDTL